MHHKNEAEQDNDAPSSEGESGESGESETEEESQSNAEDSDADASMEGMFPYRIFPPPNLSRRTRGSPQSQARPSVLKGDCLRKANV